MLKVLGTAAVVCTLASISFAAGLPARSVNGNYIEARTADVYTGPCFANGEVEQVGQEAVFGWKINNGSWQGVDVSGLAVVAAVRAQHTIGIQSEPVNPAKAVLILDNRANAEQRLALQSFAKNMAGDLLKGPWGPDLSPTTSMKRPVTVPAMGMNAKFGMPIPPTCTCVPPAFRSNPPIE